MNKRTVRQGLEEGEKTRELPEDMVHKKMGKTPDLPMRLMKHEDLRRKASKHPDLHPI
jgi:hypothetical protein